MAKQQKFRIAAAVIAILLFVLFLLVPRSPKVNTEATSDQTSAVDNEVQEALNMMEGEAPMQGILKLREILEKDPNNIDAAWNLGLASMRTHQYEKALQRFDTVLELDKTGRFLAAYMLKGQANEQLGHVDQAIKDYKRFLESDSDPQLMQDVRERLAGLE